MSPIYYLLPLPAVCCPSLPGNHEVSNQHNSPHTACLPHYHGYTTPHHTTPHHQLHHCHNTRASLTFLLSPHMSGVFLFQRSELFTGLSAARLGPLYCLCWACDVTARRHSSSSSPSLLVQSAQPSPGPACSTGSNQAGKSPD